MEFDKSRCYSALNADELKAGDKVIVADILSLLKQDVERGEYIDTIRKVRDDSYSCRFETENNSVWELAYLVERKENCTNCAEGRWDAEHHKILCDPIHYGNGNVIFSNHEIEVCNCWKPKTERPELVSLGNGQYTEKPKTEDIIDHLNRQHKNYRPFKDTDELIKVWCDKGGKWQKRELTMPHIWVRRKGANTKGQLITEFGDGWGVGIGRGEAYNMTDLWVHFTFLDGSPCGVEA